MAKKHFLKQKNNFSSKNSIEVNFNINRIFILKMLIILEFTLIVGKLFFVQVVKHDYYVAKADSYQESKQIIPASRGEIYLINDRSIDIASVMDSNGVDLTKLDKIVSNIYKYNLIADPKGIFDFENKTDYLSKVLGVDSSFIHNKLVEINNIEQLTEKILELGFPELYKFKKDEEKKDYIETQKKEYEYIINTTRYKSTKTKNQQKLSDLLKTDNFEEEVLEGVNSLKNERLKILAKLGKTNDRYEIIKRNMEEVDKNNLSNYFSDLYLNSFKSFIDYSDKDNSIIREGQLKTFFKNFFTFEPVETRLYADGNIFGQITGFLSTKDEERIGQYGLEEYYDKDLKGIAGEIKGKYDVSGKLIATSQRYIEDAKDGKDIILTIDKSIQYTACKILEDGIKEYGAEEGSISIMNPNNGEVLAMCSYPNFDPNKYNEVETIRVYQNPVVSDQLEFGSIFKAITMSSGIDSGVVTPYSTYNDTGCLKEQDWPKQICNADFQSMGVRGTTTILEALDKSLNLGSYYVASKIGGEEYKKYVKNFGFGEQTGIENSNEAKGDIRNLDKTKYKKGGSHYLATTSFGQGITVSQIQFMSAFSAIVNGGNLIRPHITKAIINDGKIEIVKPEIIRQVISEAASTTMRGMLASVTEKGYSKLAQVKGYYIGGKTGTGQLAENGIYTEKTMQSFIGFGPVSNPKFVIMVKLNNPKTEYASTSCTPLFSKMSKFLFDYYQIPPERN